MQKRAILNKKKIISSLKVELSGHPEIIFAYLHGSFLEGKYFRDIDVAIFVDEEKVPKDKALDCELALGTELHFAMGYQVDIKILNYAPLGFKYYASKGKLLMNKDDELRVDFLCYVWSRYFDYAIKSKEFLLEMLP